jgi:hypothetical protein
MILRPEVKLGDRLDDRLDDKATCFVTFLAENSLMQDLQPFSLGLVGWGDWHRPLPSIFIFHISNKIDGGVANGAVNPPCPLRF